MKNVFIFLSIFLIAFSINLKAQTNSNKPKINTRVNIKKDKNGNIISYDSTYVETWSSDSSNIDISEFMNSFGGDFDNFDLNNPFFNSNPNAFINNNDTLLLPKNGLDLFPDLNQMQEQMIKEMQEMEKLFEEHFNSEPAKNNKNITTNSVEL